MNHERRTEVAEALDWCASELGPVEVLADESKSHGGHESSTCRLRVPAGICYLKVHHEASHWHNEVHAYERWACAFGDFAPRLLGVRDQAPLALVVSELPGEVVETMPLSGPQARAIWRAAGRALVALHDLGPGECFGPCRRDGTCVEVLPTDAREAVGLRLGRAVDRAIQGGYLDARELATVQAASERVGVFAGEPPLPCHRDYCAANWLASPQGTWAGVIDFEFAHWDVRVADFGRDPDWSWIRRPDLVEAFFEGYGRPLTPIEEEQLLVAHTEYALGAILWGRDHGFYGFEQEGREALAYLAPVLASR